MQSIAKHLYRFFVILSVAKDLITVASLKLQNCSTVIKSFAPLRMTNAMVSNFFPAFRQQLF